MYFLSITKEYPNWPCPKQHYYKFSAISVTFVRTDTSLPSPEILLCVYFPSTQLWEKWIICYYVKNKSKSCFLGCEEKSENLKWADSEDSKIEVKNKNYF